MLRILIISIFVLNILNAHPHTYIDIYPSIKIENQKITQINFKWIMDEMTSSMLIMEFDKNLNQKIDKDENEYIKNNYFLTLEEFDFYTHIKVKYKVDNFKAKIIDNKIVYNFSFLLNTPTNISNFSMKFYDTDFFVATQIKKEFITQTIPYTLADIDGDYYYGYNLTYK